MKFLKISREVSKIIPYKKYNNLGKDTPITRNTITELSCTCTGIPISTISSQGSWMSIVSFFDKHAEPFMVVDKY